MKIEEIIQLHNVKLEQEVEENYSLKQYLVTNIYHRQQKKKSFHRLLFNKPVLVYGLLLIVFTIFNLIIINMLKKNSIPPKPINQLALNVEVFSPTVPGSISHAYTEVMK